MPDFQPGDVVAYSARYARKCGEPWVPYLGSLRGVVTDTDDPLPGFVWVAWPDQKAVEVSSSLVHECDIGSDVENEQYDLFVA